MEIEQIALKFLEEHCAEYVLHANQIHFTYSFHEHGGKRDGWIIPLGEFAFKVGFDFEHLDEKGKDFISALPEFESTLFVYQNPDDQSLYMLTWETGKQYAQSAQAARGALKAIFEEAGRGLDHIAFLSAIEPMKEHPITARNFVCLLNNCQGRA